MKNRAGFDEMLDLLKYSKFLLEDDIVEEIMNTFFIALSNKISETYQKLLIYDDNDSADEKYNQMLDKIIENENQTFELIKGWSNISIDDLDEDSIYTIKKIIVTTFLLSKNSNDIKEIYYYSNQLLDDIKDLNSKLQLETVYPYDYDIYDGYYGTDFPEYSHFKSNIETNFKINVKTKTKEDI